MERNPTDRLTQLSATLMAGWISGAGPSVNLDDAPVRQIVELAEKLQARAEKRVATTPGAVLPPPAIS